MIINNQNLFLCDINCPNIRQSAGALPNGALTKAHFYVSSQLLM